MDIEEAADGGRNATLCDNLGRWDGVGGGGREVGEGGDICISMADPCCCMTETNTILQSNYPSIKKKKKTCVTKGPASCTATFRFCPRGNGNHGDI